VLEIDPAAKDTLFTVYRGDYIKFSFAEKFGALNFRMPQLDYQETVYGDPGKSAYFKMKKTGSYPFTLGEGGGEIKVVDLVRTNYVELSADQAADLLKNLQPFILDVRTPAEKKQGYIEGSHLIPIQQLQARLSELEERKHQDIFIYCATGNRSTVAARILADSGFKRIYNLRYGINDWARRGHPYQTGE
jgi:rhodanese-related sulfurtransferase